MVEKLVHHLYRIRQIKLNTSSIRMQKYNFQAADYFHKYESLFINQSHFCSWTFFC